MWIRLQVLRLLTAARILNPEMWDLVWLLSHHVTLGWVLSIPMGCGNGLSLLHLDSCSAVYSHCAQTRTKHTKPPSGKHTNWTLSDVKSPGLNINNESKPRLDTSLRKTEGQKLLLEDEVETRPCYFTVAPGRGASSSFPHPIHCS